MSNLLWSLRFVNSWENLRLVSISGDLKSFVYENEAGERKRARIGTVVTREFGIVDRIARDEVTIVEHFPVGPSGDPKIKRVLNRWVH